MSEYLCSMANGSMYEGCNDCKGLRRVIKGRRPRKMADCACNPRWVLFTKRTDDPKLRWIELQLDLDNVPHRRSGESWHAPILEVREQDHAQAESILRRRFGRYFVDDIRDDHPRWQREIDAYGPDADVDTTPIQYGPPHGGW